MQAAPEIKGWCPGALTPMESGDGLLLRAKIVGSKLSLTHKRNRRDRARLWQRPDRSLAARATANTRRPRYNARRGAGASQIHRTARAGRGDGKPAQHHGVSAAGAASPDANEIAARLARAIAEDQALASLPGKFLFSSMTARRPVFAMSTPIFDSRRAALNSLSSWTAHATKPSSRRRRRRSTPRSRWRAPSSNCGPGGRSNCVGCAPWSSDGRGRVAARLGAHVRTTQIDLSSQPAVRFARRAPGRRKFLRRLGRAIRAIFRGGVRRPRRSHLGRRREGIAADAMARDFGADAIARTSRAHCRGGAGARVHRRRRRRASRHRRLSRRAGMFAGERADAHWPRRHRRRRENAFPRRNWRACGGLRQGLRQAFGDAVDAHRQWRVFRSRL